jgi:indolepyruvate ferredoxin oxidoreductase beta subunit
MLASEVIEAGRALELGFVTPDRTTLAAATHRIYAVVEKSAMADGRFDATRILDAASALAKKPILFDLTRSERTRELSLNAVMLGIAAASGVLPMKRETYEAAIREAGIAVAQNQAAFELGCALAETGVPAELQPRDDRTRSPLDRDANALIGTVHRDFPAEAAPLVEEGVRRLVDYQDLAYARRYYERVRKVAALDRDGALTSSVARHMALWMSYEDVIRVADLKTRPERFAKLRAEIRARPDEPVRVREFMKPGLDEIGAVLPHRMGAALQRWTEKHGHGLFLPMRLKSTTLWGFLRLWCLARLKRFRPMSYRFVEENRAIDAWLDAILRSAPEAPALAREIAECARLLKGYSDTHRRGRENFRRIFAGAVLPALGHGDGAAKRIRALREAALADPDGATLDRAFAAEATRQAAE